MKTRECAKCTRDAERCQRDGEMTYERFASFGGCRFPKQRVGINAS